MKVLFLEIDTEKAWGVASLGPAFIAPFLRKEGHEVLLHRVLVDDDLDDVARTVQALAPSVIGLSLTTRQWLRGRDVVQAVRKVLDVPVIAGGLHPTFAPEDVLATPGFDYVCLGEGEEAMRDLLAVLEKYERVPLMGIRNIWAKGGTRPPLRAPFEPMDAMPFMARDMLDEKYGVVNVTTQRGCPFPCTYCAARMYDEMYDGTGEKYGRRRSHQNVLEELAELRRDGQLNYVIFLDDTFTIHHPWVKKYCALHSEHVGVPFSIHARVETVNPEMLRLLAEGGCKHIVYGVESGSERVRREIMHRPVTNQRFIDVFRWTRDVGINVVANYMLGVPGETREDVEMTLALHDQLLPDDFGYFVFYPYPGTHLFKLCRERGYLPENYLELPANHRASILRLPDLSIDDIAELYDRFSALRARDTVGRSRGRLGDFDREQLIAELTHAAAVG